MKAQGKPEGGYCSVLRCWLTERQCRVRRTRAVSGSSPGYISCIECGGKSWTKEKESKKLLEYPVEQHIPDTNIPTDTPTPASDDVMFNRPVPSPVMIVCIDFTLYPELYEWLKQEAKKNFRPIEYQILAGLTDLKG